MTLRAGIFVGGEGRRMGGIAKGLLPGPDGAPLVLRARAVLAELGLPVVLVGAHPAYAALGLPCLADDPAAPGPLGGLLALLAGGPAIAVACDMPAFSAAAVRRLLEAPPAPIVAPRRFVPERGREVWEPLFARYAAEVLPIARHLAGEGVSSLQQVLSAAGAQPVALGEEAERWLTDWDLPSDVAALPGAGAS